MDLSVCLERFLDLLRIQSDTISYQIQTSPGECELAKKCGINKKLSIFVQFWWNLVKMTTSWLGQIAKISAWYHGKCGFFVNDTFLSQSGLGCQCLYTTTVYVNLWGKPQISNWEPKHVWRISPAGQSFPVYNNLKCCKCTSIH